MKTRKLKAHIPETPSEWLEYVDHRERWTPEMQVILDQHMRDTFPLTLKDRIFLKKAEQIRLQRVTLH